MIVRGGYEGIQRVERVNDDLEQLVEEVNEGSEDGEDTLEDINDAIDRTNGNFQNATRNQQRLSEECEEVSGENCVDPESPEEIEGVDEDLDVNLNKDDYTLDPAIGMLEGAVSGFVRGSFLEVYVQFHNDTTQGKRPVYSELSLGTSGALILQTRFTLNQNVFPQALYLRGSVKF